MLAPVCCVIVQQRPHGQVSTETCSRRVDFAKNVPHTRAAKCVPRRQRLALPPPACPPRIHECDRAIAMPGRLSSPSDSARAGEREVRKRKKDAHSLPLSAGSSMRLSTSPSPLPPFSKTILSAVAARTSSLSSSVSQYCTAISRTGSESSPKACSPKRQPDIKLTTREHAAKW